MLALPYVADRLTVTRGGPAARLLTFPLALLVARGTVTPYRINGELASWAALAGLAALAARTATGAASRSRLR